MIAGRARHAAFPARCYAHELALTQEGQTHRCEGYAVWDYYIYAQPVLAPTDGLVIYTSDGDPDQSPSAEDSLHHKSVAGNYLAIEVEPRSMCATISLTTCLATRVAHN
jgi:hypothetical protein